MPQHTFKATMAIVLPRGSSQFLGMNSARSLEDICSVSSMEPTTGFASWPSPDMVLHEIFSTWQLQKNKELSVSRELKQTVIHFKKKCEKWHSNIYSIDWIQIRVKINVSYPMPWLEQCFVTQRIWKPGLQQAKTFLMTF